MTANLDDKLTANKNLTKKVSNFEQKSDKYEKNVMTECENY